MQRYFALCFTLIPAAAGCVQLDPDAAARSPALAEIEWSRSVETNVKRADADIRPLQERIVDPQLAALIAAALEDNPDLAAARARVSEARALSEVDLSRFGLQLDLGGSVAGDRQSETSTLPVGQIPGFETEQIVYQAGFDASWEIDLFGRRDVIRELGALGVDAEALELRSLISSLVADLSRAYLDAQAAARELELVEEIIARQLDLLEATKLRRDHGEASDLDVERASAEVAATRARRPALLSQGALSEARLAVLLGRSPAQLQLTFTPEFSSLLDEEAWLDTTSDVLRRRPDVLLAELNYAAAAASLDLTRLDYYPSLSLFASAGPETTELSDVFDPASLAASLGGLVNWALLDGGRRNADVEAADARLRQSGAAYRGVILQAVEDVEARVISLVQTRAELADRQAIAVSRSRIAEMARARYEGGAGTLIDVLETERDLADAEVAVIRLRAQAETDRIALEKALGLIVDAKLV